MREFLKYLVTEYKRAAVRLPGILLKAAIPAVIVGMAVFCVQNQTAAEAQKVRVGIAAPDSALMNYGIQFIEGMDAIKSYCSIERTDEATGKNRLTDGELDALIFLPEKTVEGILSGNNVRATLYLANDTNLNGLLLEELLKAGVGALKTAQEEIYTASTLAELCGMDDAARQKMFEEIDAFNLKIYLNREGYFKTRTLSETDNESEVNFYGSSILTLYFLLAGVFFSAWLVREKKEGNILAKRKGIPVLCQLAGRLTVLLSGLWGLLLFSHLLLFIIPGNICTVKWSLQTFPVLFTALLFVSSWTLFLSCLTEKKHVFPIPVVLSALLMGYGAGCIVPLNLMPAALQRLARWNPAYYLRRSFLSLLSGNVQESGKSAGMLLLFSAFSIALALIGSVYDGRFSHAGIQRLGYAKKGRTGNLFIAVLKRTMMQKTLWISLLLVVSASLFLISIEKKSENKVVAAFYTENAGYENLLSDVTGLISFTECSSEEELKRLVLQGKAECGYILQDNLQNEILEGNGNWSITVYENEASTMTKLINEVLFERIFYQISMDKFEGYIAEKEEFASATGIWADEDQAFSFDTVYLTGEGDGQQEKEKRDPVIFYPADIMALLCVLLCTLSGILQVIRDRKEKRIFNKGGKITVLTVLYPTLLGLLAGFLIRILMP